MPVFFPTGSYAHQGQTDISLFIHLILISNSKRSSSYSYSQLPIFPFVWRNYYKTSLEPSLPPSPLPSLIQHEIFVVASPKSCIHTFHSFTHLHLSPVSYLDYENTILIRFPTSPLTSCL